MQFRHASLLALLPLLALTDSAPAQDNPGAAPIPTASARGLDQALYKGLVGNVLDTLPMDPLERLGLQRTNAVVSSTMLGRSLNIVAGLGNPVLLLGGFVWGLWAAKNIKPAETGAESIADLRHVGGGVEPERGVPSPLLATAADEPAAKKVETIAANSISPEGAGTAASPHPRVIKIWLPQRSTAPAL
jgi:hypothetical protein